MSHLILANFWLHDLYHPLKGLGYQFWSGAEAAIETFLGWVGLVFIYLRRHNCHVHHCPRVGRYHVEGSPYVVCKNHHPGVPKRVYHRHVNRAHYDHQRRETKRNVGA